MSQSVPASFSDAEPPTFFSIKIDENHFDKPEKSEEPKEEDTTTGRINTIKYDSESLYQRRQDLEALMNSKKKKHKKYQQALDRTQSRAVTVQLRRVTGFLKGIQRRQKAIERIVEKKEPSQITDFEHGEIEYCLRTHKKLHNEYKDLQCDKYFPKHKNWLIRVNADDGINIGCKDITITEISGKFKADFQGFPVPDIPSGSYGNKELGTAVKLELTDLTVLLEAYQFRIRGSSALAKVLQALTSPNEVVLKLTGSISVPIEVIENRKTKKISFHVDKNRIELKLAVEKEIRGAATIPDRLANYILRTLIPKLITSATEMIPFADILGPFVLNKNNGGICSGDFKILGDLPIDVWKAPLTGNSSAAQEARRLLGVSALQAYCLSELYRNGFGRGNYFAKCSMEGLYRWRLELDMNLDSASEANELLDTWCQALEHTEIEVQIKYASELAKNPRYFEEKMSSSSSPPRSPRPRTPRDRKGRETRKSRKGKRKSEAMRKTYWFRHCFQRVEHYGRKPVSVQTRIFNIYQYFDVLDGIGTMCKLLIAAAEELKRLQEVKQEQRSNKKLKGEDKLRNILEIKEEHLTKAKTANEAFQDFKATVNIAYEFARGSVMMLGPRIKKFAFILSSHFSGGIEGALGVQVERFEFDLIVPSVSILVPQLNILEHSMPSLKWEIVKDDVYGEMVFFVSPGWDWERFLVADLGLEMIAESFGHQQKEGENVTLNDFFKAAERRHSERKSLGLGTSSSFNTEANASKPFERKKNNRDNSIMYGGFSKQREDRDFSLAKKAKIGLIPEETLEKLRRGSHICINMDTDTDRDDLGQPRRAISLHVSELQINLFPRLAALGSVYVKINKIRVSCLTRALLLTALAVVMHEPKPEGEESSSKMQMQGSRPQTADNVDTNAPTHQSQSQSQWSRPRSPSANFVHSTRLDRKFSDSGLDTPDPQATPTPGSPIVSRQASKQNIMSEAVFAANSSNRRPAPLSITLETPASSQNNQTSTGAGAKSARSLRNTAQTTSKSGGIKSAKSIGDFPDLLGEPDIIEDDEVEEAAAAEAEAGEQRRQAARRGLLRMAEILIKYVARDNHALKIRLRPLVFSVCSQRKSVVELHESQRGREGKQNSKPKPIPEEQEYKSSKSAAEKEHIPILKLEVSGGAKHDELRDAEPLVHLQMRVDVRGLLSDIMTLVAMSTKLATEKVDSFAQSGSSATLDSRDRIGSFDIATDSSVSHL